MGVYNPLTKMPLSCAVCESRNSCPISSYSDMTYRPFRHPDCLLVEIKVPHGRLIDADKARCTYIRSGAGYNIPIIEAETVLEAEGKDDGKMD